MKIVVLTTVTPHHVFFVRELHQLFPLQKVLIETELLRPPFDTCHPFEKKRDDYETGVFFQGNCPEIYEIAPCLEVPSVNSTAALVELEKLCPDIVISFGIGKVSSDIIKMFSRRILNLHGGDPQKYRGLDTHLWAIYHNDYASLITSLHHVDDGLDTGDIVDSAVIRLYKGMDIHELRRCNTELCLSLTKKAISRYIQVGHFPGQKQAKKGRLYSFMPGVLKDVCVKKFERYINKL